MKGRADSLRRVRCGPGFITAGRVEHHAPMRRQGQGGMGGRALHLCRLQLLLELPPPGSGQRVFLALEHPAQGVEFVGREA
ncbi:hypothetical protein RZS08_45290, partial [Arthrospira platensis SPKY1]|nr:hypothetical protein [Arthrospira platensis SPKY1]